MFGLPGGYCNDDGNFYNMTGYGLFWSSSVNNTYDAWSRDLGSSNTKVNRNNNNKNNGLSVRCLRDLIGDSTC